MTCPVCGSPSRSVHGFDAAAIRPALAREFSQAVPEALAFADYDIRECLACRLGFADPMLPGDQVFYDWITAAEGYTARSRWEWGVMLDLLSARSGETSLLELGCGTGLFLEKAAKLPSVTATGIDNSATSVAAAQAKGLIVRLEMVEDTIQRGEKYDVVVLSHILEHVADPVGLMEQVKAVLTDGGQIMCSLPYSPMSREFPALGVWDPMNLPPHHLTRWNDTSFAALAVRLGMRVHLHSPKPKPVPKRALQINAKASGAPASLFGRWWSVVKNPGGFADIYRTLCARDRIACRRAGDVVLAVFR